MVEWTLRQLDEAIDAAAQQVSAQTDPHVIYHWRRVLSLLIEKRPRIQKQQRKR